MKPLAIDLFCGLGGWSESLLAEGWRVIGYDIEEHRYGDQHYPGELVLQDVLTLHGSQFKDASLIVASPPCQEYSYMAMPWSKAKAIQADYLSGKRDRKKLTALFDACFRIQREASEAAGRYIPMVVENVRGAQKWVGKARWNFGSYYLWGDVPALMPITGRSPKMGPSPGSRFDERPPNVAAHREHTKNNGGSWFNIGSPGQKVLNQNPVHALSGLKSPGMNWSDQTKKGQDFTRLTAEHCGQKGIPHKPNGHWKNPAENGVKQGPAYRGQCSGWGTAQHTGSKSNVRKAASAMIAKIPAPLASWIAKTMKPL